MDEKQLESLFISNPSQAIEESRKIILSVSQFESYEDFQNYHYQHKKVSNCEENLFSQQLTVLCFTCSKNHSFAVCLSCFLKGNHEGHYYMILPRFSGHCACGDSSCWKQSGCCTEHSCPPEDHPESYIDEKLRQILTDLIFKASISALTKLATKNDDKVQIIIKFIASFLRFGDGFYRLVVTSLTEKIDFKSLMKNVSEYSSIFNQLLNALCLYCFHDKLFKKSIESITYSNLNDQYFNESLDVMIQKKKDDHYQIWESFWSQVFTSSQFQYNIEKLNWNWVPLFIKLSTCFKEIIGFVGNSNYKPSIPCYYKTMVSDISIITKIQPNEETQNLFDSLFTQVFCSGTSNARKNTNNINVVASFKPNRPENYYIPIYTFQSFYPKFFKCFKYKPHLKFDVLINQLDKLIVINSIYKIGLNLIGNENKNEKFIQRFIDKETRNSPNLFYYKSFHNGGSFFMNLPLYDSLVSLFRIDNLSRIKIAKFLCLKNYQKLRIKLGIITLKKILSFVCFHQGFVPKSNFGVNFIYNKFDCCLRTTHTISRYFSLFQLLIGLECNEEIIANSDYEFSLKEYFAFELAREIGLFDDFDKEDDYKDENVNEIKEKMIFSFLFISILIVIERTLFNLNSFNYAHEQIVFALKKGVSGIDELHGCYDIECFNVPQIFPLADKILSRISTTNKDDDDDDDHVDQKVYYYLKDGVQWNTLSAINSINGQKTLLSKEISKNPSKLIEIQEFQNEDEYFFHPKKSVYEIEDGLSDDTDESEYDLSNVDVSDLKIHLKKFLCTPTVLAVVYYCLRTSYGIDSSSSGINDHLAMNVLVLISKFVVEDEKQELNSNLVDLPSEIHFNSLNDLISKLQVSFFNYRVDEDDNSFVSNNLNKQNFIGLLKVKFSSDSLSPKSFVDVLLSKGELGRNVIDQMSIRDQIDIENKPTEEDEKMKKKLLAKARKQAILEQFSKNQSNFSIQKESHSSSIDQASSSVDVDSDCCSVCGSAVIDDLSYPVYFYRTKIPFIVDKPPFVNLSKSTENHLPVNEDEDELNFSEEEEKTEFDYSIPADQTLRAVLSQMPDILNLNGLSPEEINQRKETIENIRNQILLKYALHEIRVSKKEKMKQKEAQAENDRNELKRYTVGANYVIQFGICPHPIHPQCMQTDEFKCPLCKAYKNGFLPYIDSIPRCKLFLNEKVVDGSQITSQKLTEKFVHSISLFIEKFKSFLGKTDNVFIELIKSISGLIVTYELRLRNLKKCLDPHKNFDLSRNLFLASWFAYRIEGKPPIIDDDSRLTTIQRYVKRLIENDCILDDDFDQPSKNLVSEFLSTLQNFDAKRKREVEEEVFLFLRRVALSDFFLLDKSDVEFEGDRINWSKILSAESICQKYGVDFETRSQEFVLNPLIFTKMPKDYFDFSKRPFSFRIEKVGLASIFNFLDYSHLIDHFENFCDDDDDRENSIDCDDEVKRMKSALLTVDKDKLQFYFKFDYGEKICPSVLIYVGGDATKVVVVDKNLVATLKPFYFNFYNRPDVGFTTLQPLKLNEKSYIRFMDEVLSGDFSYNLEAIL